MFQQFKSIFPEAAVINIKTLADSVGLNEDELLSLGKEKFEALRSEFQNFNSLLASKPDLNDNINRQINNSPKNKIEDLNDTIQIFQRFEEGWKIIHDNNILNIKKSQHANELLLALVTSCEHHNHVCKKMANISTDFESIKQDMNTVKDIANELKVKLVALDNLIDKTYLEYEEEKFDEWKQQEEANFMNERLNKERALKAYEEQLEQKYQEHNEIETKKRVELYDATFQADLEEYKRKRETEVSSLYSNTSMTKNLKTKLENIKLENTTNELDSFLSDDSMDDQSSSPPKLQLQPPSSSSPSSLQPKNKVNKNIKKNVPSLSVESFFSTGSLKPINNKKQPIIETHHTNSDDDNDDGSEEDDSNDDDDSIEILGDEDYESG